MPRLGEARAGIGGYRRGVHRTTSAQRSSTPASPAGRARTVAVDLDATQRRDGLVVWLAGAIGVVGISAMLAIDLIMTQAV
jgi:hypothetical protein